MTKCLKGLLLRNNRKRNKMAINERYLRYLTGFLIGLAGLALLFSAVYYIAYLPVPAAMHPLKMRVLTALQLEGVLEKEGIFLISSEEEMEVYLEPDEGSEVLFHTKPGKAYEILEEEEEWTKVKVEGEKGWIKENRESNN